MSEEYENPYLKQVVEEVRATQERISSQYPISPPYAHVALWLESKVATLKEYWLSDDHRFYAVEERVLLLEIAARLAIFLKHSEHGLGLADVHKELNWNQDFGENAPRVDDCIMWVTVDVHRMIYDAMYPKMYEVMLNAILSHVVTWLTIIEPVESWNREERARNVEIEKVLEALGVVYKAQDAGFAEYTADDYPSWIANVADEITKENIDAQKGVFSLLATVWRYALSVSSEDSHFSLLEYLRKNYGNAPRDLSASYSDIRGAMWAMKKEPYGYEPMLGVLVRAVKFLGIPNHDADTQ